MRLNKKLYFLSFTLLLFSLGFANNKKFKIEAVKFEGNKAFGADRLHNVMVSRPSSLFNSSYYYPSVLEEDLKNLTLFYQQQGYLQAEVTGHQVKKDTSERKVRIHISLKEGPLTRVEGITIFGNHFFTDKELKSSIKIKENDPLIRKKIEDSNVSILTRYANQGFLEAEVQPDVRVDSVNNRALIDFIIRENVQFHVGDIRYSGLEKTDTNVVRRELRFKRGDVVNYSRLLESQRELYLTGLFQSVFIRPKPSQGEDSTLKEILVDLKENKSIEFNVSIGYGTLDKVRGQIEIYDDNLAGTGRKASVLTRASFINRRAEASFTEPWTFGTRWQTDVNLFVEYLEEPGFNLNRTGGRLAVGREFLKRSRATLSYRQENVKLSRIKTQEIPDNLKNDVRSLQLSLVYDTRDNLFNSTRGNYVNWSNESFGSFLSGDITFFRSNLVIKYFKPLFSETILATAIDLGWISAAGGLKNIPLNERYYTGGPSSLRGFEYQKVGPLDANRIPTGGRMRLVWNAVEIRQTIYKMIGGVVFADLGNVWANPEAMRLRDVRQALGIGLRVNTPVGLARVDYGFNINPRPGEPRGQFYFGMGQTF